MKKIVKRYLKEKIKYDNSFKANDSVLKNYVVIKEGRDK